MRWLKTIAITVLASFLVGFLGAHQVSAAGSHYRHACGRVKLGKAHCNAILATDASNNPLSSRSYVSGYGPADLVSAYKQPALPAAGSYFSYNNHTVAVVDAYDNPRAASDLVAYRKQFKLPLCKVTVSNPSDAQLTSCFFRKINQAGNSSPLPAYDPGWASEISLDIEMVSAICPNCKIVLVEANSASVSNLGRTVDTAAAQQVNAISNSYGGTEFGNETLSYYANHYNHPGIPITVSAGDEGYGVEFPASSPYVTAVGGTILRRNTSPRGWKESAWTFGGSGCSKYVSHQSWQPTVGSCANRVVADVAAEADPNTGVAVYDNGHWYVLGGTSVGAPIIASIYALAGNSGGSAPAMHYGEYPYAHSANLFDVFAGSNGSCVTNLALCSAGIGYDGPTGLGSPNGLKAF